MKIAVNDAGELYNTGNTLPKTNEEMLPLGRKTRLWIIEPIKTTR